MSTEEEKLITITLNEYIGLQQESWKLSMLENAGVDNWCGYGEGYHDVKQSAIKSYGLDPEEVEGFDLNDIIDIGVKHQYALKQA